jgi:predicted O-linked N-acetylglucosamine transferase (SPINDLY family)
MQTLSTLVSKNLDREFDFTELDRTVSYYESLIDRGDNHNQNYWYLGLAYLLQQRELDAQATWFIPFDLALESEIEALNHELVDFLDRVASEKFNNGDFDDAWAIGRYLREIDPTHVSNLLRSILLEIKANRFTPEILQEWECVDILSTSNELEVNTISENLDRQALLANVLESLLYFPSPATTDFIRQCLISFADWQVHLVEVIARAVRTLAHRFGANSFTVEILEICLIFQPKNTIVLQIICYLHCCLKQYKNAIEIGNVIYNLCDTLPRKIVASHMIIGNLLSAGDWNNAAPLLDRHARLIETFINEEFQELEPAIAQGILVSIPFLTYAADRGEYYRFLQNQLARIYLEQYQPEAIDRQLESAPLAKQASTIRIGYIGSTLHCHSVGWLSRWLLQYADRSQFQIFTYCINQNPENSFYQQWFRDRSDVSYCLGINAEEIAAQIQADDIDILIDLDSLTLDITAKVLAAKPAKLQASWLGWDATGLSTVDYFIADRYVLPDCAQDYYQEKIWRLPQCYVAVTGFEVGTPTISRKDLDIPSDAIIYWSGQKGYKRHPDTVRAQMRILRSVPNSYFLIKGDTDPTIIEEFFGQIAAEEGIDFDRLRFLGNVADELTHRANLAIADIVLDTFPYNGATTTLETLWMGIPMVTQVGQQFAARNSYTFMLNAGITEGIAWNQAEYIEWGIKLGLDRDLRMQVREKLRAGRQTAPVWNAKQFTLEMEQAYREMWAIYQAQQSSTSIDSHDLN